MFLEDLGELFKGDPMFDYYFNKLPKGHFLKIVELRRKRRMANPTTGLEELVE